MYLRFVVLISSLVSLGENKPRLLTMSSHLCRASHPFFTTSWTPKQSISIRWRTQKQKQKQKERQKSIAYLVGAGIGGCGVDLAGLLKERRQRHVIHSALSFRFDSIRFPPIMSKSEAPRLWRKGKEKSREIENEKECGRVHATYTCALHSHLATS